jgi:hypothetical protein
VKEKIIELLDNDEFDFTLDLVKGANDGKLYDSLIEETRISEGLLLMPEWVGWEGSRTVFFLTILQYAPETELIRKIWDKTEYLYFRFADEQTFPDIIFRFNNLTNLEIKYGNFKTLPPEIGSLQTFEDITFKRNGVQVLPQEIGKLKNLRRLDLPENELGGEDSNLEAIGELENLKILLLDSNELQVIPACIIPGLRKLNSISLNFNEFSQEGLDNLLNQLSKLPELKEIFLRGCGIKTLAEIEGGFEKLTKLDLEQNEIAELPDFVTKIPNLEWLPLKENPIYTDGSLKSNQKIKYEYESWEYER